MGSEEVPSGVLTLAESGIAPQAGAPPLEGYDLGFEPTKEDCLLVIDLQVDFACLAGPWRCRAGTEVFPLVNAMIEKFERVVMSQDWHPPAHSSFASQHEGKAPYDVTSMPYGKQTLWPDHCVQGTSGCVTRVGFSNLIERVSRAYTTPRATPPPILPRSRLARPDVARRASFARATPALDPRCSPLDRQDPILDVDDTPSTSPPFPRASTVSRLARVSTDSPIILDTRPSPTAPDFTRTSPFPSVRW